MNTILALPPTRTRRRHSPEFKAQAIAACLRPGVSIAGVALANQLNANMLRQWVKAHHGQQGTVMSAMSANVPPPTLVPVSLQHTPDPKASGDIQIEIRRQQTVVQVTWPTSQSMACAQWLREVLR